MATSTTELTRSIYFAPSSLRGRSAHSFPADMFPFGLVLFEMMAMKVVGDGDFAVRKPSRNFTMDYDEVRTHLDLSTLPTELVDLATLCTDYEVSERSERASLEEDEKYIRGHY